MISHQAAATCIVLSSLGVTVAGYLTRQHYKKKPLVCPLNHDCSAVTESKYGSIFLVKNELLGLIFYLGMLAATVSAVFLPQYALTIYTYEFYASIGAAAFSGFLVYLQLKVLKNYCFYCMVSALITVLLLVNTAIIVL